MWIGRYITVYLYVVADSDILSWVSNADTDGCKLPSATVGGFADGGFFGVVYGRNYVSRNHCALREGFVTD